MTRFTNHANAASGLTRHALAVALAVWLAGAGAGAFAQDSWETIGRDRNREVQLDRASIIGSDGGTKVAWARIVLPAGDAAEEGYAAIKALNRFDCMNRSFQTVKRVYVDGRNIVLRDEDVPEPLTVLVARNSVDERLWREVCRPAGGGGGSGLQDLATRASEAAAAASVPAPPRVPAQPRTAPPTASPAPTSVAPPAAARAPTRSATGAAAGARRGADWSFEGVTGPAHWADLRADWRLCRDGRRQSPINLVEGLDVDLAPPQFDYRPSYFRVVDTGRMLQVQVGEGLGVSVRGERYDLTHVQLHAPVSEQVDDIRAAAAVHLHHRSADGRILVVVVLLALGPQANPFVQTVLNNLPLERGSAYSTGAALDLSSLLPFDLRHYLYVGSLVTPPCTEGVTWVVLRQAGVLSEAQLQVLTRLYPYTARPAQPAHERRVLRSR